MFWRRNDDVFESEFYSVVLLPSERLTVCEKGTPSSVYVVFRYRSENKGCDGDWVGTVEKDGVGEPLLLANFGWG